MFTPWNEIRLKKYLSSGIPVAPLWQDFCNLSCAIPLGIYNSNIRFFKNMSIICWFIDLLKTHVHNLDMC